MAHDVFISYSAKDKTTADAVCAMLESNGIRCWIAPRDVLPSMEWSESIIDAIEECRIMVLVFTANANDSPQIRREVERAVNHGIAILPLRVEDVLPGRALEYFIGNVHWLDALTPPFEAHLKNLAGTIKIVLARMEPSAPPAPLQEEKPPSSSGHRAEGGTPEKAGGRERAPTPHPSWSTRAWTWAAGTVAALALVAVFIGVHFTSHPAPVTSPQPASTPAPATPRPNAPGGTAPVTPAASPLPAPTPRQGASKTPKSVANAPEATADNSALLRGTMNTLQNELSSIGTVSFTAFVQNKTDSSAFQYTKAVQVSNVVAEPAYCEVSYHFREWQNGSVSQDVKGGLPLRYATGVVVEPMSQKLTEVNAVAGHANWVVTSTNPPATALLVRLQVGEIDLPFTDANLARAAAATITQAVKLCGGFFAN